MIVRVAYTSPATCFKEVMREHIRNLIPRDSIPLCLCLSLHLPACLLVCFFVPLGQTQTLFLSISLAPPM